MMVHQLHLSLTQAQASCPSVLINAEASAIASTLTESVGVPLHDGAKAKGLGSNQPLSQ